jgi:phage terminase large subunit GpA-like protein
MRAVMDAAIDPKYKRVVLVAGAQMSKTELLLNLIGYRMDIDPAPILFISASQRLAESVSTSRLMPMIRSTPALLDKLDTSRSKLKITEKFIAGQRLGFGWAGSAIELSSHPAHTVLIDERDRMAGDVDGEGDPVALAEARTATYADGKVVVVSTPTLEGASPIWDLYSGGTMSRWTWACPDCLTYFAPEFALLQWDPKATPQQAKRSARLACPHCGSLIEDKHRAKMNAGGRYEITGDADSDCASFHISGLASPWRTWGEAAKQWIEAVRSGEPGRCQAVKNTTFGELFVLEGERPTVTALEGLKGAYVQDEVPVEARVITAGVDLQGDKLVYAVRAWGPKATSWLVHHGEIWGDTDQAEVWEQLAELVSADYGALKMRLMLVDSGFRPDRAYAFARRFPGRVQASKGHAGLAKPVNISKLEVDSRGKTSRHGVQLAHVDTHYFKSWLFGRIAWPIDQPGAWHLAADVGADYLEQILAESRVVKKSGQVIWIRNRKANHFLDCEVLNAAAGHLLGVHSIKGAKAQTVTAPASTHSAAMPPRSPVPFANTRPGIGPPRRKGGWVTNW